MVGPCSGFAIGDFTDCRGEVRKQALNGMYTTKTFTKNEGVSMNAEFRFLTEDGTASRSDPAR